MNGAAKYIEFLKQAFDAIELTRSSSPDGRLLNASVRIANSAMMLNDVFPEFGGEAYRSGRAVRLTLYLPEAHCMMGKAIDNPGRVSIQSGYSRISPNLVRPQLKAILASTLEVLFTRNRSMVAFITDKPSICARYHRSELVTPHAVRAPN